MKKTRIKKIIAFVLAALIVASVATGCSIIEYNEDRDMRQVVLHIKSFEMEYEVPFTVPYKDAHGNVVEADGRTKYTVQRDANGEPVYVPVVKDGNIVFAIDDKKAGDDQVVYGTNKDEYFTTYTIENGKAVSATVYRFSGITAGPGVGYTASWANIDDVNDIKTSTAAPASTAANSVSNNLPTVYFTDISAGGIFQYTDWYFITATPEYVTEKWYTPEADYTKQDLINYYNRSSSQFENQTNTLKERFDIVVRGLYTLEFMYIESENYIKSGKIEWGLTEENLVKKNFYDTVDGEIKNQFSDIFGDHNEDYSGDAASSDNTDTTYPVPTVTTGVEKDTEAWTPATDYLGFGTSSDRSSLVREAVRRWITSLVDVIDEDNTISEEERKEFLAELADLKAKSLDAGERDQVYPNLLKTEIDERGNETYVYSVMWYLYGQTYDRNLKSTRLQEYIESTADISATTVTRSYNNLLAEQRTVYDKSYDSFVSAVTGSTTVLYYPTPNSSQSQYFYVKHILVPFKSEITEELTSYRDSGRYTDENINKIRLDKAPLNDKVTYPVYEHVNGEDDLNTQKSVQDAYDEIAAKVNAKVTPKEKADAFEAMIFKYNTDPGIFNKETGYAVSVRPEKENGPKETYVIEFATAARKLRTDYLEGKTGLGAISEPILGDYGYHILFLLKVPGAGETVGLYNYLTISEQSRIYDVLASGMSTEAYSSWSNRRASFYDQNEDEKYFEVFVKRYKDLYDK